ncbi:hypothetical protein FMJ45_09985 [Klebsiella michiganensis]|uniref:Uncharacterized protein n=1 Tax=Klebsiella michiganensis TaxID=1134687 RepID=A0A2J4YVV2_9ENTR|nr:hypothetical protein C2U42_12275 [Klebsiella oxytoca]MBF8471308.1 hypothetical protein [Klebsiella michiganensis]MBZ6601471.1 hypothetical protein [Klebsiella michiganensis]MBZ7132069.1 hypothetical protein [Klebsiella michiganensis]MBZ7150235.1 hypothetical protein [Klebsiella michiganensis]
MISLTTMRKQRHAAAPGLRGETLRQRPGDASASNEMWSEALDILVQRDLTVAKSQFGSK